MAVNFVDLDRWTPTSTPEGQDVVVSSRSSQRISSSLHQNRPEPSIEPILEGKGVRARVLAK